MKKVIKYKKELKNIFKIIVDKGFNIYYQFDREMIEITDEQKDTYRQYEPGQAHFKIWGDLK